MSVSKVFVIDDSPLILKVVTDALATNPAIRVVGTARNGVEALERLPKAQPDIIFLDVDMPRMNGLDTLAAIRRDLGKVPVIMFSNMTRRGADETLDALQLGANDYVTKPTNLGSLELTKAAIRDLLGSKIELFARPKLLNKGLAEHSVNHRPSIDRPRSAPQAMPGHHRPVDHRVDIVCLGISTGGPPALQTVLSGLPTGFPVPILIVQHMPPVYTATLAQRLDEISDLTVTEAVDGAKLQPGHAYVAPGDRHLVMTSAHGLGLRNTELVQSCRPSVDVLFESAAKICGRHTLGLVMTGMGRDGLAGSRCIQAARGTLIAQDQASSTVWGMPGSLVRDGLVDQPVALNQISAALTRAVAQHRA